MSFVRRSVAEADAILMLVDLSDDPKADLDMIQLPENWEGPSVGIVMNKMDLLSEEDLGVHREYYVQKCRAKKVLFFQFLDRR